MNAAYVVFDLAIVVLAIRSIMVLGRAAPWGCIGWTFTAGYFGLAAWRYAHAGPQPGTMAVAEGCFIVLATAFIIAVVRDEPQAEPVIWPMRVGLTRAEKRR